MTTLKHPEGKAMNRFIRAFTILVAARPVLLLAVILVSIAGAFEPALAQSILNGDASKPVRAIRRAVDVAMWATLAMGIFGLCWAGWNKTTGKAWGSQAVGAGLCLGISGVIAFVNQIVNGDAPTLGEF
jgi:hypothetical protein